MYDHPPLLMSDTLVCYHCQTVVLVLFDSVIPDIQYLLLQSRRF
jgi:hypothetical protein